MGLFSPKRKGNQREELPPLNFPELPQRDFPDFEEGAIPQQEVAQIKQAITPPPQEMASHPMEEYHEQAVYQSEEKPLFVKIEKYREVMSTVNELKKRLNEASAILTELNKIKEEEERELNSWHDDLELIKERLMSIDKTLFES
ncbi:MAG: hypothetical protein ABIB71_09085 [Candidatus Woesearchaeota archaeon]